MADLSQLSNDDLKALQGGDLSSVSNEGLKALAAPDVKSNAPAINVSSPSTDLKNATVGQIANILDGITNGTRNMINSGIKAAYQGGLPLTETLATMGIFNPNQLNQFNQTLKNSGILPKDAPQVPAGESFRDMAGLPQPNAIDKLEQGAASFAPTALGSELAGVKALSGLQDFSLSGLANMAKQGAVEGGFSGMTNNPDHPGAGLAYGTVLGGLAPPAVTVGGKAIFAPRQTLQDLQDSVMGYLANRAGETDSFGNRLLPDARTPTEAAQSLQKTGQMPTTLGQLTNIPELKAFEKYSGMVPLSGAEKQQLSTIGYTDNYAKNLIDKLSGGLNAEDIPSAITQSVQNAEQAAKSQMAANYQPIEDYANAVGLRIQERPNLQRTAQEYLSGNAEKIAKGIQAPRPDLSTSEQNYLQQLANPDYITQGKPELAPTFGEMRGLESNLKSEARNQAASGNFGKQQMYNDLADSVRQDYDHNANLINVPGVQDQLEQANNFAKENYYDVFNKPDVQKILDGTHPLNTLYNTLTKPENAQLLQSLPQETKNLIYLNGLKNNITDTASGVEVNPTNLAKAYMQGGAERATAKQALLDAPTQQQFDNLIEMQKAAKDARVNTMNAPTGAKLLPAVKLITGAGAFMSHPVMSALTLLTNRGINNYLRNPATLQAYLRASGQAMPQAVNPALTGLARSSAGLTSLSQSGQAQQ